VPPKSMVLEYKGGLVGRSQEAAGTTSAASGAIKIISEIWEGDSSC
jgi:hypothetical protein